MSSLSVMDDVDGRASGVSSTGKYRVYIKGLLELERMGLAIVLIR